MKKGVLFLCLALLLFGFVLASTEPSFEGPAGQEDVEKIQDAVDKIPIDNSGNIDEAKLNSSVFFVSSKAQARIDAINLWLTENAPWLSIVLGMVPQISFLFFWNFWVTVYFLTFFVFNGGRSMVFIEKYENRHLFGFLLFVVFLVLKAYYFIAKIITDIMGLFWNQILPWGIVIATILIVVFAIVFIALVILTRGAVLRVIPMALRMMGRSVATSAEGAVLKRSRDALKDLEQRRKEANAFGRATSNREF